MSSSDVPMQARDAQDAPDTQGEQRGAQDQRAAQEHEDAQEQRGSQEQPNDSDEDRFRDTDQSMMARIMIGETSAETDAFLVRVATAQGAAFERNPRLMTVSLPGMMTSWGREWLSGVRGRCVKVSEWWDFLGSGEVFPPEAWLEIAQLEYDGYAGDSGSLRDIKADMEEAMDAMDLVQPHAVVSQAIRKQVRGILGGRRQWLFDEHRLETTQERSARVAERRARDAAAREARAARRQSRHNQSGTTAH